jgi:hypothetical protein
MHRFPQPPDAIDPRAIDQLEQEVDMLWSASQRWTASALWTAPLSGTGNTWLGRR